MASDYLSTKTGDLERQTPVDPAQARAAQIPLENFTLPAFPQEAFTSNLSSLILTSDIKFDEYQSLLGRPVAPIPPLPPTITSLTLELFSLGYPPGFLTQLGASLPNLKSLTLYSQLLPGTTSESRADALAFAASLTQLQELHLLDVFAPEAFWPALAARLAPPPAPSRLRFLEVNFAYRHSDPGFLKGLPSADLPALVRGGLLGLTLSISEPDISARDDEDREGTEEGVLVKGAAEGAALVERLVADEVLGGLVMCDLTMFELGVGAGLERILDAGAKLKILSVAVGLEEGWEEVLTALGKRERAIEVLEVVGVPGVGLVEKLKREAGGQLTRGQLEVLGERCKALRSVKVSILRTRVEGWIKGDDGVWSRSG